MDELTGAEVGSIQPYTHSFVVKVWLVDRAPSVGAPAWRGRITHVPSGQSHHFVDLHEISTFVGGYLRRMGVRRVRTRRLRRWLRG